MCDLKNVATLCYVPGNGQVLYICLDSFLNSSLMYISHFMDGETETLEHWWFLEWKPFQEYICLLSWCRGIYSLGIAFPNLKTQKSLVLLNMNGETSISGFHFFLVNIQIAFKKLFSRDLKSKKTFFKSFSHFFSTQNVDAESWLLTFFFYSQYFGLKFLKLWKIEYRQKKI